MSEFLGADPGELMALAGTFDEQAVAVAGLRGVVSSRLLATSWVGPDLDSFSSLWFGDHVESLIQCESMLRSAATRLRAQSNQQVRASRATTDAESCRSDVRSDALSGLQGRNVAPVLGAAMVGLGLWGSANNSSESASSTASFNGYKIGPPERPDIKFDDDFVYNSKNSGPGDWMAKTKWLAKLNGGRALRPDLDDATAAYAHYWENSGKDLRVDYEEAYREDEAVRNNVNSEVKRAVVAAGAYVNSGQSDFRITGPATLIENYPTTENWQKTLGGYQQWSSAEVVVDGDTVHMKVTVHAEDRYNFNRGQSDLASGASDDENGRFTEIGWAKPFNVNGSVVRELSWKIGDNPGDVLSQLDGFTGVGDWNPGREDRADSAPCLGSDSMNRDTGRARVP